MQDVTDLAFMRVMQQFGGPDYYVTEYFRVHADYTVEKKILRSITENDTGRPVYAQLIGQDTSALTRVAQELLEHPVAGIDLNLGRPAPVVCRKDAGGGLLRNREKMEHIIASLRDAISGKFTVKTRVVRLLTMGALEEADGDKFKDRHTTIVTAAKAANADGLDEAEKKTIRDQLNTLNDDINAAIKEPEQGDKRTPVVNRSQHRFEEKIEFGERSGRLSTLEASSLRRKLKRLEDTEDRLKTGQLSSNERERLMEEVIELRRDLMKELRD